MSHGGRRKVEMKTEMALEQLFHFTHFQFILCWTKHTPYPRWWIPSNLFISKKTTTECGSNTVSSVSHVHVQNIDYKNYSSFCSYSKRRRWLYRVFYFPQSLWSKKLFDSTEIFLLRLSLKAFVTLPPSFLYSISSCLTCVVHDMNLKKYQCKILF